MSGGRRGLGGGLGIEMDAGSIGSYLRDPSGIADLLMEADPQTGVSPAHIFADIINVMRVDNRVLGQQLGVDVDADRMEPERAAELLAGVVDGDGIELVVMFNQIAEQRDRILREALDDEEYDQFMAAKHAMMHTEPVEDDADGEEVEDDG